MILLIISFCGIKNAPSIVGKNNCNYNLVSEYEYIKQDGFLIWVIMKKLQVLIRLQFHNQMLIW